MIDLHTHVLPGIDDGPADAAGAIAIAEVAALDGVRALVATPHLRADHPNVVPEELAGRAAGLSAEVAARGFPVEIVPGAEVDLLMAEQLPDERLALASLGGTGDTLLLETPYTELRADFEERVLRLQRRGFRLVLAHPERNRSFQERPRRLKRLVEAGVLTQITAHSVKKPRSATSTLALLALHEGWAHVLASDAHDVRRRPPDLYAAIERGEELLRGDTALLRWMTDTVPRALIAGEAVPPRPAARPARRWFARR